MQAIMRITVLVLSLAGGTSVAMAQSSPDHSIVTGSEANSEELFGGGQHYSAPRIFMQEPHRAHRWHHHSHWR
jgi:hypothetical protein